LKRGIIVLGRFGTVLVAIGLAMMLISSLPTYAQSSFSGGQPLFPGEFQALGSPIGGFGSNSTFYFQYFSTLTPQQELKVHLTCNGTVNVYLVRINMQMLVQDLSLPSEGGNNATLLEEYLSAHSGLIVWRGTAGQATVDYTPTEIINASLLLSNPGQESQFVQYDGQILNLLAPAAKARNLAYGSIPVGLILAVPWMAALLKREKSPIKRGWRGRAISMCHLRLETLALYLGSAFSQSEIRHQHTLFFEIIPS
jgi:hypothetical protein